MTFLRGSLFIFALAFAIRVAYVFLSSGDLADPAEMEFAAANLAREGSIANVFTPDSGPSAHISPGYAVVLAGVYSVCDYGTPVCRRAQQFVTAFISSITIALFPALGRRLRLRPEAGWLAGISLALSPLYWFDEVTGSWEQPFSALLLLGLIWSFVALRESQWRSWRNISLCGLIIGWIALSTPSLLPAPILMFGVEWLRSRGDRIRMLGRGLIVYAIAGFVVSPWAVRNYRVFGAFIPFRSNLGLELWIGNNPRANGKTCVTHWKDPQSPFYELHPIRNAAELDHLKRTGEWAYMNEKKALATDWIAANPGRFGYLTVRRAYLYWLAPPEVYEPATILIPIRTGLFAVVILALLLGLIRLIRTGHPMGWLLTAAILGGSAVYMVTHVDIRYRYPIFGVSVLVGCDWLAARLRRKT